MTAKQPTPQGISALLRKAGFTKAAVKLRGGHSGYRVTAGDTASVRVWHYTIFGTRTHEARKLAEYAEAIAVAGWKVEDGDYDLIVTAKPEASSLLTAKDGDNR